MLTVYGIPNCDTMKKAFDWLKARGVAYQFHDYKQSGIGVAKLKAWSAKAGWEKVLNKASTTFKDLPPEAKVDLTEAKAIKLMIAQPSMIKRPLIEIGDQVLTGFRPDTVKVLEETL
ncbi:arsenate reductase [Asticcacaulis sp. AC402]|uniref:arsenate reductase n=1 Tax=Asticcacaulis sp. AC402 TaxID=1282361 RepID=UPI0003C3DDE0|nr:arsenate reductase [Asticcacaulis sp. AC402]ESQ76253.1 ArsC family transcriptional regulator [Asticcacaulis sp. AC402]